jgi:hypothetical protein
VPPYKRERALTKPVPLGTEPSHSAECGQQRAFSAVRTFLLHERGGAGEILRLVALTTHRSVSGPHLEVITSHTFHGIRTILAGFTAFLVPGIESSTAATNALR